MSEKSSKPVAIGSMKLRDLGNSYGFTVCKDALAEIGILDEDGELATEDVNVRSIVYDDGRVQYDIPVDDVVES